AHEHRPRVAPRDRPPTRGEGRRRIPSAIRRTSRPSRRRLRRRSGCGDRPRGDGTSGAPTTLACGFEGSRMRRPRTLRAAATLLVTGLATVYIVWKIDIRQTAHVLANASVGWWLAAFAIWILSVWPLAWRWRYLLAASGVHERLGWVWRTRFVSYGAAQVLPPSLGGDASRIYETTRRHRGVRGSVAGTVLLERAL